MVTNMLLDPQRWVGPVSGWVLGRRADSRDRNAGGNASLDVADVDPKWRALWILALFVVFAIFELPVDANLRYQANSGAVNRILSMHHAEPTC